MIMPSNANLYAILHEGFSRNLDALAAETPDGQSLSYAEPDAGAGRYASALARVGAQVGDRVAVQVEKSPEALWGTTGSDVLLHALPMFHTHGLFVACNTSLLRDRFSERQT